MSHSGCIIGLGSLKFSAVVLMNAYKLGPKFKVFANK